MQRQIPAGSKLAVMGDHQVVPCFFVLVVGVYGNIALLGRGLAVHLDDAVHRLQGHVFFCRHRINVRPVVAYMDVARIGLQGYAAPVGSNRFHNVNIAFGCDNRHILFCGYASLSIPAYRYIAAARGQFCIPAGRNILSYQDIAGSGLQAYRSLVRVDGTPDCDVSFIRFDAQVVCNVHVPVKNDAAFFLDSGLDAFFRLNIIRNMDVAVASVEGNASPGDQLAVITDDEVAMSGSFFIFILSGCHGNVAVRRGCHSQNVNGSQAGLQGNILFRRYGLVILYIIGADVDIAFARLHRYVCILGFDGFGNEDAAFFGNGRHNIAGAGNNVAAQHNITILLHVEADRLPRNERGLPILSRVISLFNAFR